MFIIIIIIIIIYLFVIYLFLEPTRQGPEISKNQNAHHHLQKQFVLECPDSHFRQDRCRLFCNFSSSNNVRAGTLQLFSLPTHLFHRRIADSFRVHGEAVLFYIVC